MCFTAVKVVYIKLRPSQDGPAVSDFLLTDGYFPLTLILLATD